MDETGIETAEPIFELATKCESLFSEHISRLKNEPDLNGAKVVGEYQQRFSAWAAFLGVFAVPDMCLDRRLRNHAEVQDLVLRLLDIMKRNLVHLLETDHDKFTSNEEDINIPDLDQVSSPQIRVNLESLRGIEAAVDRLNHLGRTIQRSSEAGQATKVGKFVTTFDSTSFEEIARLAVKSFYPDASTSLLEQLIQTMTDMYERFHYRRSRQVRLQARPKGAMFTIGEEPVSALKANTKRASLQPTAPPISDVNKQLPRLISMTHLEEGSHKSKESKPTSLDSREFGRLFSQQRGGSVGSKTRSILVTQVAYPQPSEESLVCDWCFVTLSKDELKGDNWKKHLNEDFKPFICISEKCKGQVNRFATSRAWFSHMLETHGQNWHREIHLPVWWICPLCNNEETTFSRAQDLSEHLSKLHDDMFTRPQIQVIVHQSQLRSPRPQDICPLCCLSMRDEDQDKERQHLKVPQSGLRLKDQMPGESHKRVKTETGSIQQIQSSDAGSEVERGEGASNTGAQAAPTTQRVNIEAISRHVAAHLQGIMLFTLRIMSLDVANTTADEKSLSNSTDHDSSRVGSGQKRSEQERSTTIDISEEQDSSMDVDGPSIEDTIPDCEHIIDWQDIIISTQQFPETDSFLQEVIRSGAFHSKESTSATSVSFIGSVQDAIQMHITDSRDKLRAINENALKRELCQMSLSSIATTGMETMLNILEGHQHATPVDLLCFIHIVFSLSLVIHEHDALKYAATLFKQALLYSSWFSEPDRTSFIEVVITLWEHNEVDDSEIIQLLQPTIPDSEGNLPERSLHILKSDPLVLLAAYFLDELEYKTLLEYRYGEQPSELADQHFKNNLMPSYNSPFIIAAISMIENIFSRQYSHFPEFELGIKPLINLVNAGGVGTVRRLELELMQVGKTYLPSDVFFNEFIEVVRHNADQLYAQSRFSGSRSTYHRWSIQLINSLIALPKMPITRASIPPPRNEYFVCPEDVFNIIIKHSSEPSSCVALVGLGGIGKSQLALEFAHSTAANSPEVWIFWIYADTQAHIEEGFRRIAECVELPGQNLPWADLFQLVYNWLSDDRNDRWIIIFDNVYDELPVLDIGIVNDSPGRPKFEYGLKALVYNLLQPQRRNGSIIVTTRDKTLGLEFARYPRHVIEIKPMPVVDATALFRKILGPKFQAALDMNVAINLVKALGLIPLAIAQAALYIEQHLPQITLTKYLEKLEESDREKVKLLEFDAGSLQGNGIAPNTILTTLQMSFNAIRSQQPSAVKLLSLMSFFNRRGIPKYLIAPDTQDDNIPRANSPNIMGRLELSDGDSDTDNDTDDTFNKDIEILMNHHCIAANRTKEIFEMHGLVQLAAQMSLDNSEIQTYREQFIHRLAAKFPSSPLSNWSICQELFAHVQEAAKYHPSDNVAEDWAAILYNGGRYARLQGDYDTAKQMSNKVSMFRENTEREGGERMKDMRLLENLSLNALILMDQGLYEEAHKLFTQIVDGFNIMEVEGRVEANHPNVLTSMNNLASIYRIQGRWREAEKLIAEVEDRRKEAMAEARAEISQDTPSVLATLANRASIYRAQGRYEAAEGLQEVVLINCKTELGEGHPQTLTNMSNLASIYRIRGELERAEQLQAQAMNIRDIKFGREHPDTLTSMNSLASIFRAQGRLSDAEELQVQVVELRKEKLGSAHPNTLASMNNLALIYKGQGKGERAIELQSVVVKMCEAKLGPNHPHTLTSINNMALIWKSQGEHEESMRLMKFCSEHRQKSLGQEHPYTVSSMAAVQRWSE